MTVPITTRAAKGSKLLTTEVDDNFLAGKSAIEALQSTVSSIIDAATDTTIADTATGKIMLDIAGVPKKISVDDLVEAISTPASGLAVAAALSGSDIITISQDGGATEVRTTLSALAVFLGATPVAATGITLSGPTSGVSGSASTNFTVGVTPSGGTLTGTVTVTPSDSSGGGTFTPTAVSLTTSGPTATFTYTPASAGAKTISITNNGSLTNPSNITYAASASATAPGAPTGVTATAGNASASVAFTAPASNGGSAITGYTVTSSPGGFTGTGSASPISVTGLSNGTAYTFTVACSNIIGTSTASSPSSAVTPSAGSTVPGQVTGLTRGTATSTTQPLTWTAPSNGGSAITDYVVQWSPAGAGTWTTFADGTSTTAAATVTGLTASTSYDYRVAAVNAIGTGTNSATSTGSTAAAGAPAYLFAPTAYQFTASGDISTTGYWHGETRIYVKTAAGATPLNVKMAWGTSPTVPPAQYSDTSIGGHNFAIMLCGHTGGWVQGGSTSQDYYGLYSPSSDLYAYGTAGTYYLWVLTDDGFAKAYDNNTGTPIGVVLT